ncbi:MAG: glycoside hydrolase family 43 protein [Sphaerochaetaceae bacterium]|nr:glycoside hydrolase family 43 protein [Sphaerochaetaceae bacterium]
MILREHLQIRDPFIFPIPSESRYYLFGTTDTNPWNERGNGFEAYITEDLIHFDGPHSVFSPPSGFWGTHDYWAPEVHRYRGMYYMFASFKSTQRRRGTQILSSASILGPYAPLENQAVTPFEWECLDGTLFVDRAEHPWIVFCHEWVQIHDGTVCAMRLSEDLKQAISAPLVLFHASDACWSSAIQRRDGSGVCDAHVTDGPFLQRLHDGTLIMLWSSITDYGYAMGQAHAPNGRIEGPWIQNKVPLITEDGGHGMIFTDFSGHLNVVYHTPNTTPHERLACSKVSIRARWFVKEADKGHIS